MTPTHINNFFSIANTKIKLVEEVRKHFGKETSPRFNSFDFWWIDENKVSQILAFFLDPNENHEQGDVYLKHFINKFKLDHLIYNEGDDVKVTCELYTSNGRFIDIVVFNNTQKWAIGIENKINIRTDDQFGQLTDYNKYLFELKGESYSLIYLSPLGKVISEDSMSWCEQQSLLRQGRFKHLTYEEHIIECISEFARMTESIRVRSFLKDFEKTLRRRYMGERYLENKQVILDLVKNDIEYLEVLFLANNTLPEVKLHLKELFKLQMIDLAKELDLEFKDNDDDDGCIMLKPKSWNNHWIGYVFDVNEELYFMIPRSDREDLSEHFLRMRKSLVKHLTSREFKKNESWWIYSYFGENIRNDTDFWLKLKRGELKNEMKKILIFLNREYNSVVF